MNATKFNPISTYRIQFHKEFNFKQFENIIPYLHKLGIKTIYASPVYGASPGSIHGYNGVNPNNINPEIGTLEELIDISKQLKEKGIAWIQDIVPNHMSFDEHNPWIMDVLEKGQFSAYADFFDIDWNHPKYKGKLMVPFPGSELEKKLKKESPKAEHYVICDWQETDKHINYRRFFIVNSLICINIQNKDVFDKYHVLTKYLIDNNIFSGLRIDHIDGLADPKKYLENLRALSGDKTYIVVEKILEPGENIPNDWPIEGNSGYDFLGMVNNLFTNRASEPALTRFYNEISGNNKSIEQLVAEKKELILYRHMMGELDNLARLYKSVSEKNINDDEIQRSIAQYLIGCPVYRYYGDNYPLMKIDDEKDREKLKPFYKRCMQFSGPLMAKGVEDTLMYTYNRFIGHNEVGDSPVTFGMSANEFHDLMKYRQQHSPLSMNATSTHDTKRGEDARARLNAMTDLYEEWIQLVKTWMKENETLKTNGMPDRNDEYFIYQALLSSATPEKEENYDARIKEYLHKALREAKTHSEWSTPNEEYENAAIKFAGAITEENSLFRKTFNPFLEKIISVGTKKSLAQLVLKFTCPGIPDTYQGTELWDLSLVDPDNRRPIDYNSRAEIMKHEAPHVKLNLLIKLLSIRNDNVDIFTDGDYIPLKTEGKYSEHIIAFLRKAGNKMVLVAVQVNHTNGEWEDTKIILPNDAPTNWEDLIHKRNIEINNRKFLPGSLPSMHRSF